VKKKATSLPYEFSIAFETGISTDAIMIILLRTQEVDDELIEGTCQREFLNQNPISPEKW